jgi:predicted TIM-barrel fold metal-dependent hydrolase
MRKTPFGSIEVFDAHTHFFSHAFFEALAPDAAERAGFTLPPEDPAELGRIWVDELDRHGVRSALMMASVPGDEASVGAAVAACPDRIAGAFMVDPTRADRVDRAGKGFDDYGLRVACLFPAMHGFSVADSEGARTIAAIAAERPGTAVFVHFGALSVGIRKKLGIASRFDLRYSNPLDLHPLACEFPTTSFIIPHFGAGMLREALMVADLCSNVYLDTSSSNRWMSYLAAETTLDVVFRRAIDCIGHARLLFGSDSSFFPRGWHAAIFDAQVAALEKAGADEEAARAIFGGNLRRLLTDSRDSRPQSSTGT